MEQGTAESSETAARDVLNGNPLRRASMIQLWQDVGMRDALRAIIRCAETILTLYLYSGMFISLLRGRGCVLFAGGKGKHVSRGVGLFGDQRQGADFGDWGSWMCFLVTCSWGSRFSASSHWCLGLDIGTAEKKNVARGGA